jgi:hypothetical protein
MKCKEDDKEMHEKERDKDGGVMTCVLQARNVPAGIRRNVRKCHEKAVKQTVKGKQLAGVPAASLRSWTILTSFSFLLPGGEGTC